MFENIDRIEMFRGIDNLSSLYLLAICPPLRAFVEMLMGFRIEVPVIEPPPRYTGPMLIWQPKPSHGPISGLSASYGAGLLPSRQR